MQSRTGPMNDRDLAAIISQQISLSSTYHGDITKSRDKAIAYYEGEATLGGDVPPQTNRSSVVSRDMSDTHGWLMPQFMRIFTGSDNVVQSEPRKPGGEDAARQATDYINYVFKAECDGYQVLHSAIWDALTFGNGIIKHWWDDAKEYKTETLTNLTELEFLRIASDPDVKDILEYREQTDHRYIAGGFGDNPGGIAEYAPPKTFGDAVSSMDDGGAGEAGSGSLVAGGQLQQPIDGTPLSVGAPAPRLYDIKIKRCVSKGRLRVVAVPPEEFRLDRAATRLDEDHVRFSAHVTRPTRSQLITDGYPRDIIDDLPAYTSATQDTPETSARDQGRILIDESPDRSTDEIEIWECYVQLDFDGDGVAEWLAVVPAAGPSGTRILGNEEWDHELRFTELVPEPMPHRWQGSSLYEE